MASSSRSKWRLVRSWSVKRIFDSQTQRPEGTNVYKLGSG